MKHTRKEIEKRKNDIIDYLKLNPNADIEEIAKVFNISTSTIRRDIHKLREEGEIRERWTGLIAKHTDQLVDLSALEDISMSNIQDREAIAKKAIEYLEPNDIIFVNTSSSALRMYPYIPDIPLTIITNNAMSVTRKFPKNIHLVLTGGEVLTNFMNSGKVAMTGGYAIETLSRIQANKCFLGVSGISAENGISTKSAQDIPINQTILEHTTGKVIVLADHTKIGRCDTYTYAPIEKVNILITDNKCDPKEIEKIQAAGVEVIIVEEI